MLMKSYNKLFIIINWVYLYVLENTMSSLLSMALPTLIQPYRRIIVPYYVLSNLVSNSNHNLFVLFLAWCSNFTDIKIQTSKRLQNGKKSKIWKLKNHFFSDWKAITSLRLDLFQQRKVC